VVGYLPSTMAAPERPYRLPLTVVLFGLTSLFTDIGTEMIFPLLPVFLVDTLKAAPAYVGLVEGAADTVSSLLKLVSGYLADRMKHRKPLVFFGYGIASVVRPFVALATHPWHVLAVRVTDRVGKGLRGSPRDALIADAAGDKAGRAFGFQVAMDNVGAVVGPLIATLLVAEHFRLQSIFWLTAIPGGVATLLVLLVRETPKTRADAVAESKKTEKAPALSRTLVSYLAILTLFSLGNSTDGFLLLRAHELGVTTAMIPVLWAALNFSKVVWTWLGGGWSDRWPRVRVIAVGWLVYALVYLGLGRATESWHVWALFVVYGAYYGLTEPVEKALVKDLAAPEARGRAYGAYNFVVGITALPAGLLTGVLWRAVSPAFALEVGAGLAGVSCVLLAAWNAKRKAETR
jgi:MFS family permease